MQKRSQRGHTLLATPQIALSPQPTSEASHGIAKGSRSINLLLVAGVVIALGAILFGIACTGISMRYFLQPTGAAIVLGGTLGVTLVTTPRAALLNSLRRVAGLLSATEVDREVLIEEIISYARIARRGGVLSIEPMLNQVRHPFLREALQLAADIGNRQELQLVLETEVRLAERQGEADARALEIAAGYAPTLGIIGTVVGLIDVLRQFANLQAVGSGIGTAFVSTIYGLALANLLLLPAAHRIRACVAGTFEDQDLIVEGVLAILDSVHPSLVQMRLHAFLSTRAKNAA